MKKTGLVTLFMCGFVPLWSASPYVSRVIEFVPAPGQFVNLLPAYNSADNAAAMLAKVNEDLVGKANGTVFTLGAWGGYVVVGFDHTIANVADAYDFQINGNAFANNAEPGVVMRVTMCADRWCRVEGQGRSGYLLREHGFGVYPNEPIG